MKNNINNYDEIDRLVNSDTPKTDLAEFSEKSYIEIVNKALSESFKHLTTQNYLKAKLRDFFTFFFTIFVSIQYIIFVILLFLVGYKSITIETSILLTYASSIFVETIGVITYMIKFAYANKTELGVLEVAKEVVNGYKKYHE